MQTFWSTHYLRYAGTVHVAAQRLEGAADSLHALDLLVAGAYRWFPRGAERVSVGGRVLAANDTVVLGPGANIATLLDAGGGDLILAIDLPRTPIRGQFYSGVQVEELVGARREW